MSIQTFSYFSPCSIFSNKAVHPSCLVCQEIPGRLASLFIQFSVYLHFVILLIWPSYLLLHFIFYRSDARWKWTKWGVSGVESHHNRYMLLTLKDTTQGGRSFFVGLH
ncbi:hypothetical protein VPH35_021239 [Triticum aestivum]